MADLPIPYQPPMIRALLEDRKTQTRRTFDRLRRFGEIREFGRSDTAGYDWHFRDKDGRWHDLRYNELLAVMKYQVGDRLYVREHWRTTGAFEDLSPSEMSPESTRLKYLADGFVDDKGKSYPHFHEGRLRQGMHMPRWASRLTQIVTDVRVEPLQNISEADALAEGITCENVIVGMNCYGGMPCEVTADRFYFDGCDDEGFEDGVSAYAALWDCINGTGAWGENPFVAAYTVRTIKSNIDQIGGDA